VKLSCASWSFPHLTLRESVHLAKTLGVQGLDLGLLYRGGLDREALLTTPEVLAASLAGHSFFFPCYSICLATVFTAKIVRIRARATAI